VETIGKYQIQRVLGRGGMGTVYEALDPFINRKVALKTMIAGLADNAELKTRFLREAQAAGGLRHRNIVTVYDLGEDKGQPYIAMEFIEGTDLEKVIQNREPRSVEWKLDVLRQLCAPYADMEVESRVRLAVAQPANLARGITGRCTASGRSSRRRWRSHAASRGPTRPVPRSRASPRLGAQSTSST